MSAICHRCGSTKSGAFHACPECKHAPRGTDLAVAWLFSKGHLNEDELVLAAARIRGGELPDPSAALRAHARSIMGLHSVAESQNTPLDGREVVAVVLTNLLLTPLAGLAVWWGLKPARPTAARQALRATVPIGVLLGLLWTALVLNRLFG